MRVFKNPPEPNEALKGLFEWLADVNLFYKKAFNLFNTDWKLFFCTSLLSKIFSSFFQVRFKSFQKFLIHFQERLKSFQSNFKLFHFSFKQTTKIHFQIIL
jgi:hypothetical protein